MSPTLHRTVRTVPFLTVIGVAIGVFLSGLARGEGIQQGGTSLDAVVRSLGLQPHPSTPEIPRLPEVPAAEKSGHVYDCRPGPWGNLEYYYIYMEAPASLVERFPMPNSVTKWSFPGWTSEQVRNLFEKAHLGKAFQDAMLEPNHFLVEEGVLTVFPPQDQLEAMTPDQRGMVYEQLGQYDENELYKDPVLITCNDMDDWLKGTHLRSGLEEKLRKFLYKKHEVLALSDLSAMLNYVVTDQEARDLQRLMTRNRTLILRLKVGLEAEMSKLAEYWEGPGHRNMDIQPILQSSLSMEGITRLDITHLLPPLARERLFSYPKLDMALLGRIPDCHWTSLNFFNTNPKDYYLNTRLAADQVLENYEKIGLPSQLGDILMFIDKKTGLAVHSCAYVADDIVYTKNGDNLVTPWILMKLDELKRVYFFGEEGVIQAYRLKAPAQNG